MVQNDIKGIGVIREGIENSPTGSDIHRNSFRNRSDVNCILLNSKLNFI